MIKWILILFFGLVLVSFGILAFVLFFNRASKSWMEGFIAPVEKANPIDKISMCAERTSCSQCINGPGAADESGCGWCVTSSSCVPKGTGHCEGGPDTNPSLCMDTKCEIYTSCDTCTVQPKCGWCPDQGRCVTKQALPLSIPGIPDMFMPDPMDGKKCSIASFITSEAKCGEKKKCKEIRSCKECASTAGCGFCAGMDACMDVTNESQCFKNTTGGYASPSELVREGDKCEEKDVPYEHPELEALKKLAEMLESGPLKLGST